jgi:hypothetical protein
MKLAKEKDDEMMDEEEQRNRQNTQREGRREITRRKNVM